MARNCLPYQSLVTSKVYRYLSLITLLAMLFFNYVDGLANLLTFNTICKGESRKETEERTVSYCCSTVRMEGWHSCAITYLSYASTYHSCAITYLSCAIRFPSCAITYPSCAITYPSCAITFLRCYVTYLSCAITYLSCAMYLSCAVTCLMDCRCNRKI